MADSADIAVQSSNYRGDAVLGGSGGEAFKFDMKPLEQLSAYVNLQNKTFWEQKQKNADKLVDQLATITDLDVNNLYGGDRDKMIDEMTQAKSKIADTLRNVPSDPSEYAKWYANAQEEIGKISGKYATRKQRTIDRASQITLIQEKYPNDPKAQAAAIKRLDEQFSNTDGKLERIPLWQPVTLPKMPVTTQTIDVYNAGKGNMDVKSSVEFFSPKAVSKAATQISVLGFNQASQNPPKTITDSTGKEIPNPAYAEWAKGKSKEEISFAEVQNLNNNADETKQVLSGGTDQFKSVIAKYYDADGNFDEQRFRKENSGNTVLIGNLDALQKLSTYSKEHKSLMNSGSYVSQGINYRLPKSVSPDEFDAGIIDDYRAVTPEQMLISHSFSDFAGDKVQNKEIMTNSADERAAQANSLKIARENNKNEIAKLLLKAKIDGYKKDANGNWIPPANGSEAKQNKMINKPAVLFQQNAERVKSYFERKGLKDTDGMNVPIDKLDPITRKALGMGKGFKPDETPDETKDDVSVTFFKNGTYKINKKDGTQVPGTAEGLAQGYINALGTAQGFQVDAENAFEGTGQDVWDRVVNEAPSASTSNTTTGIEYKGKTYSDQQIEAAAKANGVSKEDYINWLKTQQ